jgi:hypothetical protein
MRSWKGNLKLSSHKVTSLCGLLGAAVLSGGCIVTAIPYHGQKGEPYSLLNHFISEMGYVGVSKLADVFNGCQMIGGLILAMFMFRLGQHLRTRWGYAAAALGVVSGVSGGFAGCIPMNYLVPHLTAAYGFFFGGLITVGLFSFIIGGDKGNKLPQWLVIPGLFACASFAAFLALPVITGKNYMAMFFSPRFVRPDIWAIAVLEWLVFLATMAWIVLVSACLGACRSNQTERGEVADSLPASRS